MQASSANPKGANARGRVPRLGDPYHGNEQNNHINLYLAVVSSEGFGALVRGWVVSGSQAGALRLPRLRARTFLFVASATLAAKAGVGQAH